MSFQNNTHHPSTKPRPISFHFVIHGIPTLYTSNLRPTIWLTDIIIGHGVGNREITCWEHTMTSFMETISALLAICAGNSPVPGEFPTQRPVTRSCDVFFDLRLNKRLSKQPWGWWFETISCPICRHSNEAEGSAGEAGGSDAWC